MIVPRRFAEFFEDFGICASFVIGDDDRDKMCFDEFNERLVGEDFGPEVTAAFSSGDFLKEEENGFV